MHNPIAVMNRAIIVIIIIITSIVNGFISPHYIIYDKSINKYYLIINNKYYCQLNDIITINELGFNENKTIKIDSIKSMDITPNINLYCPIKLDYTINLLKYSPSYMNVLDYYTIDEITSICINYRHSIINKINMLNNNLNIIKSIVTIGNYINPSMVLLDNKFIMSYRIINKPQKVILIDKDYNYINDVKYLNQSSKHILQRWEEDVRLFKKLDGNILMVLTNTINFYNLDHYGTTFLCVKDLIYNKKSNKFYISKTMKLDYNESTYHEKNWTPFIHKNDLYFIYNVYPLHILKLIANNTNDDRLNDHHRHSLPVLDISIDKCNRMNYQSGSKWSYGRIRGGTPSYLIYNLGYLGFYHSFDKSCQINYYFGAYIFTSTLPFKMLKMSHQPIVTKDVMLINATTNERQMSVIFPMSYYIEDKYGNILNENNYYVNKIDTIVISAGFNDSVGIIIRLDFNNLLGSMTDLQSVC